MARRRHDFTYLPPTLIAAAGRDKLAASSKLAYDNLEAKGHPVQHTVIPEVAERRPLRRGSVNLARLRTLSGRPNTTVRLDDEDEALLDMLAPEYGGRSSALRHALRNLAADRRRQEAPRSFLAEWDAEVGPIDNNDIAAMADRYGL